ncbi:hypothetical protein P3L47_23405 [Parabacteroides chongii]|nr:hypothetical protein [Parabacteroides chongii]WFE85028.1 hypothetical protein P3L47_23405 [Parabacteroides chongii]
MKVNIKKLHKDAVMPSYAHDTDAGLDLTAVSKEIDNYGMLYMVPVWLSKYHKDMLDLFSHDQATVEKI